LTARNIAKRTQRYKLQQHWRLECFDKALE
jgi:hypothetical protein